MQRFLIDSFIIIMINYLKISDSQNQPENLNYLNIFNFRTDLSLMIFVVTLN